MHASGRVPSILGAAVVLLALLAAVLSYATLGGRGGSQTSVCRDHVVENVPFVRQKPGYCGPASLAMVLGYWDVKVSQDEVARELGLEEGGAASVQDMAWYSEKHGLDAEIVTGNLSLLKRMVDQGIPIIVLQKYSETSPSGHYRVVVGYDDTSGRLCLLDPHLGRITMSYGEFAGLWIIREHYVFENITIIIHHPHKP